MKKPYIKKFKNIGGIKVYFVDGRYIRENINKEFTNFGQFHRFSFIPQDEIWIDKERNPGEEKFFIDSMLSIRKSVEDGKTYEEAVKKADRVEKRERMTSQSTKDLKKEHKDVILSEIRKNKLMSFGKISVWIVNGKIVRDIYFLDFTEGGHDKVYSFIPENEIWIDNDLSIGERKFVLIHELNERWLMSLGKDYVSAHYSSSSLEFFCRKMKFSTPFVLIFLKFFNRFLFE
jgi:hypothetical protein